MKLKKIIASAMAFTMAFGLLSAIAGSTTADAAKKIKVKSVAVEAPYAKLVTIAKGKSVKLNPIVTVTPDKKANKKVKYVSKNKKIATISSKGVIKAKAVGSTKVVVSSKKNAKKKVTIKVKVIKKAVKKVKLDKTSANMNPGETLALKSTVTPSKKVNSALIWTSSQVGVATVNEKGVVTAVAPGTTVIKASSTDGSKKSAKCKITVQEVTSIVKAEIIDLSRMRVTLSRAEALNVASFQIQTKDTAEGTYLRNLSVKGMSTTDNINYEITLDYYDDMFHNDQYVKLTIPSLSGNKSYEFKAKFGTNQAGLNELVLAGEVNSFFGMHYVRFDNYITGEATYSVTGLPAGLSTKVINGELAITGTPTAVADNVIATATAVDETGKSATRNIRILVGSDTALVSYIEPISILSNHEFSGSNKLYVAGGSGYYNVQPTLDAGLTTSGDVSCTYSYDYNDLRFSVSNRRADTVSDKMLPPVLAAGDYTVLINIVDKYNSALTINKLAAIAVRDGVTVTGVLVDAAGAPIVGEKVYASCVSSNAYGAYSNQSDYPTDSTGKYILRLFEGQNYDLYGCGAYADNQAIPATGANINLRSHYYKVTIPVMANNSYLYTNKSNYDYLNHDPGYDYTTFEVTRTDIDDYDDTVKNCVLYVLPGSYSFRSYSTLYSHDASGNITGRFDMKVSFTVTNTDIIASPVVTDRNKGNLTLEMPVNITIDANCGAYLTFTAPEDGQYKFSYDSSNREIEFETDESFNGHQMRKGENYVLRIYNENGTQAAVNGIKVAKMPELNSIN